MLSLNDYPKRSEDLVWRMIDNKVVIMNSNGKEIHSLNNVGSIIWELSDGAKNFEEIAVLILERFETSIETARIDVLEFGSQLVVKNIIQISNDDNSDN
ncbi:MAG: PqqD family protein [ANME-2 cluster archaeon]|nr:MAG: PqqD family protein [ANME-2 cluster archaeon]